MSPAESLFVIKFPTLHCQGTNHYMHYCYLLMYFSEVVYFLKKMFPCLLLQDTDIAIATVITKMYFFIWTYFANRMP
jgi:hypothetical protein